MHKKYPRHSEIKARVSEVRGRCPLVWFENMRAFLRRYGSYGSEKNCPLQSERFNSILACGAQKRKRILVKKNLFQISKSPFLYGNSQKCWNWLKSIIS